MRFGLIAVALLSAVGLASAQNCRFYHAAQHDFGAKQGFYLDVEGCELKTLKFILGVADGERWRFPAVVPPFEAGRRYQALIDHVVQSTYGGSVEKAAAAWKAQAQTAQELYATEPAMPAGDRAAARSRTSASTTPSA